jgi:hypothetical protein
VANRFFDPEYGEMVGISEVEFLTGISKAQLRNWRKPEFEHLAKFDEYHGEGNKVWYRLADVEEYLSKSGVALGGSGFKRVEKPNAVRSSVVTPFMSDATRRALVELADINTSTMWLRWSNRLSEALQVEYPKQLRANQPRLFALWKGVDVEECLPSVTYGGKTERPEQFYVGNVLAYRRMLADLRGWDVSDEELLAIPVGDVPPTREVK